MTSVFCPGHISCVFGPRRSDDYISTGSVGLGIRIGLGANISVSKRDDLDITVTVNGTRTQAAVTENAVANMLDGECGFDIEITHDLPIGQGFSTSASGSLGACLCIAAELGFPERLAQMSAHVAEVAMGGGLGDIPAILSGYGVPMRTVPGLQPCGRVVDTGLTIPHLTLAVFDGGISTASVINDPCVASEIQAAADSSMRIFEQHRTVEGLFKASNAFSEASGLESIRIMDALRSLRLEGYHAGMCMLGNSVFTDAPAAIVRTILDDAKVFSTESNDRPIAVSRTV